MKQVNFTFADDVFDVVKLIPFGRVTTYGHIARYLGSARSSRLVGWALNKSHFVNAEIPAHRVVNRIGVLSGKNHFGSEGEMKYKLEAEGVLVVNDTVQNFKELLWDPNTELSLLPT